ncbi:hypothetical protein W02_01800 [Nitrospira sp. KM1]|uniref:response regulator n=1 Tax=Nitrospira sp. KM1 TaxID=1936990 RepID=UPI0013A73244|nr:response regulator [Nitrospira sp. KM1]BCA53040.1 hypothetical protein W02_01800 [Nitrospira sp. KM1]
MTSSTLSKIQLRVSDTAIELSFRWKITPSYCTVKLYRTLTDPDPLLIATPTGYGTIALQEPRTLYCEFIKNSGTFTLYTETWREPSLDEVMPKLDAAKTLLNRDEAGEKVLSQKHIAVLYIDGHKEDRWYYAERLQRVFPDYRILQAETLEGGRQILKREGIDCLVLELDLPDMSGFHMLTDCLPSEGSPARPVIVLTRVQNRDLWELAKTNGAYACLWKSNTSGDLLANYVERGLAQIALSHKERSGRLHSLESLQ